MIAVLLMLFGNVIFSCAQMRTYDVSKKQINPSKEYVAAWNVDDEQDVMLGALKADGKIKEVVVKEQNPFFKYVIGGGMIVSGLAILLGLVVIWGSKLVEWKKGVMLVAGGSSGLALLYFVDMYILWIGIGMMCVFAGLLAFLILKHYNILGTAMKSFDEAKKIPGWTEDHAEAIRDAQGNKQKHISNLYKKFRTQW